MKRTIGFLLVLISLFCTSCLKKEEIDLSFESPTEYTISFVQNGVEIETFSLEKDKAFDESKIPQITANRTGYTAEWEKIDYTSITNNLTVNVIYTPNTYKILYYLEKGGELYQTQDVVFDETFTLLCAPSLTDKEFICWRCLNEELSIPNEKWTIDENLELFAVWEDEEDSWSPFG